MGFDWEQYLELARELCDGRLNKANKQARHRAAISRAYYGAFISARDVMQKMRGKSYERIDVHKAVRDDFQESDSDICNQISTLLATMVRRRKAADYETNWTKDDAKTALQQLSDANKALQLLAKL